MQPRTIRAAPMPAKSPLPVVREMAPVETEAPAMQRRDALLGAAAALVFAMQGAEPASAAKTYNKGREFLNQGAGKSFAPRDPGFSYYGAAQRAKASRKPVEKPAPVLVGLKKDE